MTRNFYHRYECDGFWAKVTIEWSAPADNINEKHLAEAENLADEALARCGKSAPAEIVHAMRGMR